MPSTVDGPPLPPGLARVLAQMPRLALAFSGGLDSRFLCHAALLCGCDVLAVHVRGPHIPLRESTEAQIWAEQRGIPLRVLHYDPLAFPEVAHTGKLRCYACKKGLIALVRKKLETEPGRVLCDGTNADDMQAYRPGLRALSEAGVRSPLAEAGLTKAAVRTAARACGLDRPEQRARPCLLTRYAYGLTPDGLTLQKLDNAEAALEALATETGIPLGDFRLRLTPAPLLQAQHLPQKLHAAIRDILGQYGFPHCTLVETRTISGFFDADATPADGAPSS